ncbi:hypothetical protein HQS1_52680 [Delftia lacustris]|nr:hypothetical protein HQS1_52680 [Delftia lacustris]
MAISADRPPAPLGSLALKTSTQTGAVSSIGSVSGLGELEGFNAMAQPSVRPASEGRGGWL